MSTPDPHNTWIYYQGLVVFGTLVIALSNAVSAYYIVKFVQQTIPRVRSMDRALKVIKHDVLKKRVDQMNFKKTP